MIQVLVSLLGFIIAISILVTVHEAGHFLVARFFGIRVLRFSIGFGRPLLRWYDKLGTEYVIAGIPLGGYVSLLGEKSGEKQQPITGSERYEAYCYKPVWVRMAVLLAGPFFNFILAFVAYWLMFVIGISSMTPILGNLPQGSIADLAGLHAKQEIVSIENKATPNWEKVSVALMDAIGNDNSIEIEVRDINDKSDTKDTLDSRDKTDVKYKPEEKNASEAKDKPLEKHILDLSNYEKHGSNGDILKELGFVPFDPIPPIVGKVLPESPAAKAGLQAGDRFISVDGKPISSRRELSEYVQPKAGENIVFELQRKDQEPFSVTMQPTSRALDNGKTVGFMGIEYQQNQKIPAEYLHLERYGPIKALSQALKRTVEYTILTFVVLKKMLVGALSVKQISGPLSIAQYAGYSVSIGLEYFLNFLAVISIGLAVINLLPIPLLDGGQLMYCVWELITGNPVSEQAQKLGLAIGGTLLLMLTILAFYNDLVRIFLS